MADNMDCIEVEKTDRVTSDKLVEFITSLSEEMQERLHSISLQKKSTIEKLSECEERLALIFESKSNNSNLFSPHIQTFDIDDVNKEVLRLKEEMEHISEEQERICSHIDNLSESARIINDRYRAKSDVGYNILESQEQDRQRIARDMHDSTVQNLTGLVHKVELCVRLVDIDSTRAKLELMSMSGTVKSVINELREIIYNLKPMSLEDLGLVVTVERYAKQLMTNHDIKVYVKYNKEKENVLPVINLSLYRVVQEACHNVIKHANASRIDINISYERDNLAISIQDDGEGFDIDKQYSVVPQHNAGYGLSIMKERIYLLSGTMNIHSVIKKGTIITINVPLMKCEGEDDEQTN